MHPHPHAAGTQPAHGHPTAAQINAERLAHVVDAAYADGKTTGYQRGYVAGSRHGRLAYLLWGMAFGAALTLAVVYAPALLQAWHHGLDLLRPVAHGQA
jgi:hypothetical protein